MTPAAVADRARHIADVRATERVDAAAVTSAMVAVRQITAWADAQNAALVRMLTALESFPEASVAEVSKGSLSDASKITERAATMNATPAIAAAMERGSITAGHVDAITRCSKRLEPSRREEFVARAESLVDVAAAGTVAEYTRRLNSEVERIRADDGEDRLNRQRRNARVTTWTDNDGMWNLRGRFDPVTGIGLASRLGDAVRAHFADRSPELCPSDPVEKDGFLRAHALERLLRSGGVGESHGSDQSPYSAVAGSSRQAAVLAVIDVDAPTVCDCGARSVATSVEWPIPVEVPSRVLVDLTAGADVIGVVVRNGVVLHAPGELNLGRATRLANRHQRRALRGLYRGCAVPGCSVGFDHCKIHHVVWWRHGGRTDLGNLLPVCSHHHSRLHADGWLLELGPSRELTITLPDGRVMSTGPPNRHVA